MSYYQPTRTNPRLMIVIPIVVINVVSVFLIALGLLGHIGNVGLITGYILMPLSLIGMFLFKGFPMLSYFSRALVGGLFIVSGMVKANDPIGFSYKLEEYFAEAALDWPAFIPYALDLSILICVAEIVLGFAVILGGKMRIAAWSILAMILFFVWLTFFTASCLEEAKYTKVDAMIEACENGEDLEKAEEDINAYIEENDISATHCVDDCGCFGDALKGSIGRSLTPWESFAKDLVLLYFVLILVLRQHRIKFNSPSEDRWMVGGSLVVVAFLCYVFDGWWFPLIFSVAVLFVSLVLKRLRLGRMNPQWVIAIFAGIVSFTFTYANYYYLPMKDYRPYRVGTDLLDQKLNPDKYMKKDHARVHLIYCAGGETVELTYENGSPDPKHDTETLNAFSAAKAELTDPVLLGTYNEILSYGYPAPTEFFSLSAYYYAMPESMKTSPTVKQALTDYGYVSEVLTLSGVDKDTIIQIERWEYDSDTSYSNETVWKITETNIELLEEPDSSFSVDMTMDVLTKPAAILIVCNDEEKFNTGYSEELDELIGGAFEAGVSTYFLSPTGNSKHAAEFNNPVIQLMGDDKVLKAVVRSNPGVLFIQDGVIMDKWSKRTIPTWNDIKEDFINN